MLYSVVSMWNWSSAGADDYRFYHSPGSGVAFTTAIRDIADEDYIAGAVRMLDALLVTFCIAMGVGLVMTLYHYLTGGTML